MFTCFAFPMPGAAAARNQGLQKAKGAYIAYLDTDNTWHPDYLAAMVAGLQDDAGRYCAYCRLIDVKLQEDAAELKSAQPSYFDYESLIQKNFIDLNGFMHRAELFSCLGGFTESLVRQQDWDLVLKYTFLRDPLYVDRLLVYYRRNSSWNQLTDTHKHTAAETQAIIADNLATYFKSGLPQVHVPETKTKITILSWDICRNHFSKAYNLAESWSRDFDVQLIGFRFFEDAIFPPYANEKAPFETLYFDGGQFPDLLPTMAKALVSIRGDLVYCVKPRLTSFGLGLLANYHFGKHLILEINDLESVVANPLRDDLKDAAEDWVSDSAHPDLLNPFSRAWSLILEDFVADLALKVTHNGNLNTYFGGNCFFIRNLKDEGYFDPSIYNRSKIRKQLGLSPQERVLLFGGMVRMHKGVDKLIEFLKSPHGRHYRLLVVGSRPTPDQKQIRKLAGKQVTFLPPQGRNEMARINLAADAVVIWLDPEVPASHYQMPYKLTDALAMRVPIIANPISDLEELGQQGYLRLVPFGATDALAQALAEIFDDSAGTGEMLDAGRRLFLRQFSYGAARANMRLIAAMAKRHPAHLQTAAKFAQFFGRFFNNLETPMPSKG